MKVIVLGQMGFCFGVKKALDLLEKLRNHYPHLYYTHEIVHNKIVQDQFKDYLIKFKNDHAFPLITCVHGLELNHLGYLGLYFDITCPVILNLVNIIKKNLSDSQVIIYGHINHQEIKYLASIDSSIIITTDPSIEISSKKVFISCQSTANEKLFLDFINSFIKKNPNIEVVTYNNTCKIVKSRLDLINKLFNGIILVLGDKSSANCNLLYNKAKELGNIVYIVADLCDLESIKSELLKTSTVFLVSATSTSVHTISELMIWLKNFSNDKPQ